MTEPTERTERCDCCRWWEEALDHSPLGACHRHAPRPAETYSPRNWPRTRADEWCGEFELATTPP